MELQNPHQRLSPSEVLADQMREMQKKIDILGMKIESYGFGGILTGPEIERQVGLGRILIDPFDPKCVGPNSYDLHIDNELLVMKDYRFDVHNRPDSGVQKIRMSPDNGLEIRPGIGYLAATIEIAGSDYYVPWLDGRSTCGRYFIQMHQTAGRGDLGFKRQWTLEIMAAFRPVTIYPGDPLCQLTFFTVVGERRLYSGRYANQEGPQLPKPFKTD